MKNKDWMIDSYTNIRDADGARYMFFTKSAPCTDMDNDLWVLLNNLGSSVNKKDYDYLFELMEILVTKKKNGAYDNV